MGAFFLRAAYGRQPLLDSIAQLLTFFVSYHVRTEHSAISSLRAAAATPICRASLNCRLLFLNRERAPRRLRLLRSSSWHSLSSLNVNYWSSHLDSHKRLFLLLTLLGKGIG